MRTQWIYVLRRFKAACVLTVNKRLMVWTLNWKLMWSCKHTFLPVLECIIFFPNVVSTSWSKSKLLIPRSKTIHGLSHLSSSACRAWTSHSCPLLVYLCRVRSQMQCRQLAGDTTGADSGFWGVFNQECFCFNTIFQAPLQDVIAVQEVFFKWWFWHLHCLSFWQPDRWALFLVTNVYLGALGCLSDSCQTNFLWIRIKFGFCYNNKSSKC